MIHPSGDDRHHNVLRFGAGVVMMGTAEDQIQRDAHCAQARATAPEIVDEISYQSYGAGIGRGVPRATAGRHGRQTGGRRCHPLPGGADSRSPGADDMSAHVNAAAQIPRFGRLVLAM
jgi:hypothetical protein